MKRLSTNWISYLLIIGLAVSCTYSDIIRKVDCSVTDLKICLVLKTDPSSCSTNNGSIAVSASGGKVSYNFTLNGGAVQTDTKFQNLGAGSYTVVVTDANGCSKSIQVELILPNSTLNAIVTTGNNTQCGQPNGSATIVGTGGKSPYSYQFGTGAFTTTNNFTGLKEGNYSAAVKDANDCQKTLSITISKVLTISYANDIKPIITASCALPSCHDAASGGRNWTTYDNTKANAANIKTRTSNKSMPIGSGPSLTQQQIDLIACWVDGGAPNN
jgi:hypothetical protein